MALPFEQQPNESAKAFAAFSLYLSIGPERSLAAVGKKLGKSGTVIERWSAKFDWPARVKAHAAYFAVVEREATEALTRAKGVDWVQRQEEHRAEEWKVRCELIELARAAIARWKANEKRCGSLEGIARLLDLASRLGRLASGMPTDKTEIAGENGGPIMVEFEAAVRKIYGVAAPPATVVDVEAVPLAPALPQGEAASGPGGPKP
ncbi:MAG TPA: hypothetical protein VNZ64_02465 [Candidatus Acidoferrum sp.]|jgi:hypothetical protein|nr:hypothetical protein [Candidatus Acidoferrum sp.]